jgi:hypothetical protein
MSAPKQIAAAVGMASALVGLNTFFLQRSSDLLMT